MSRLGHSTTRAAMIYQHATEDPDQAIAAALGLLVSQAPPAPVIELPAAREAGYQGR